MPYAISQKRNNDFSTTASKLSRLSVNCCQLYLIHFGMFLETACDLNNQMDSLSKEAVHLVNIRKHRSFGRLFGSAALSGKPPHSRPHRTHDSSEPHCSPSFLRLYALDRTACSRWDGRRFLLCRTPKDDNGHDAPR